MDFFDYWQNITVEQWFLLSLLSMPFALVLVYFLAEDLKPKP